MRSDESAAAYTKPAKRTAASLFQRPVNPPAEVKKLRDTPLPTQGYVADLADMLGNGKYDAARFSKILGLEAPVEQRMDPSMFTGSAPGSMSLAPTGQYSAPPEPDKKHMYQEPKRKLREQALGEKHGAVKRMTWDEYNALTDRQRAAIDYNSTLVQAVRKDLKMNRTGGYDDVDPEQRDTYDRAVKKTFGRERGSDTYAPETMALLDDLKLEDKSADLDDFLGLKAAITEADLSQLKLAPAQGPVAPGIEGRSKELDAVQEERLELTQNLTQQTMKLQQVMAKSNQVLRDFRTSAAFGRNQAVEMFGGIANKVEPGLGFGTGQFDEMSGKPLDINAYFQHEYNLLADKREDTDKVLQAVQETLTPDELSAFYSYAEIRSNQAEQYGGPLGDTKGVKYRSPEEFRKILGIGK